MADASQSWDERGDLEDLEGARWVKGILRVVPNPLPFAPLSVSVLGHLGHRDYAGDDHDGAGVAVFGEDESEMICIANPVKNNLAQLSNCFVLFSSFCIVGKSPIAILHSRSNQFLVFWKSRGKNITHLGSQFRFNSRKGNLFFTTKKTSLI